MKQPKLVAIIDATHEAIDGTPIHYIRTMKPIRSNSILRWDSAEHKVFLDDESFNLRDEIEHP